MFHTIMSIIKNDGHYSHETGEKRTDGLNKPLTFMNKKASGNKTTRI
ncbi:copper resistance protein [Salmonella enterica subsp. diarizonae]|nr:copper resistance protein [Salmonella enterica subsp. diarizonae]